MAGYWRNIIIFSFVFVTGFSTNYGCSIEDVGGWTVPQVITILDVFRGNIFDRSTSDIEGIASPVFATGLNGGPYLSVSYANSRFVIATNDAFEDYEEYETEDNMSVTVIFRCTGGGTRTLVFIIQVQDTNNNSPRFLPSNEFAYTILTPAAPGITVTGCFDGITVRDIDLTTERIDFTIEENPFIEIAYDAASSTTDKEFIGILRTKTFIRSLSEPITLRITATDVDRTNDPPRTTTGTVTIKADSAFQFPEEPVFSQTFYLANYVTSANGDQIVLSEPIILQSGFHESVIFILEGEFSNNFALTPSGSQMSLIVRIPLESNVLRENQILLVVRANREHTSGGSATIVVQLPEGIPLEFERAHYEGTIKDDILLAPQLILARGYEGETVHIEIFGEHALYFSSSIQGNTITLSMPALPAAIINENNVLSLEVVASTESDSAKTIVTLEIISDDNDTPVFNRPMYTGSYNIGTGLTLEQIVFDQGYDETVGLSLEGDHAGLFTIGAGRVVTITTTGIPPTMFSEQRIVLTLRATKPRTVGANTAIIISLPAARQLGFEESTYRGTLQDNVLSHDPIILSNGYEESVAFVVSGEHAILFSLTPNLNRVTINIRTPIPENIIQENNMIVLTVEASGLNAVTTTTTVLIDIIKEDITTPVFTRNIYYGTYEGTSVLQIENINLAQGFGDDVIFELEGEHSQYFQVISTGDNPTVSLRSAIPEDVIFNEKVFVFNIIANRRLTVGANAAIVIRFPTELTHPVVMKFAQNTYKATLDNNNFRADNIILTSGYQTGTEFTLTGDYSEHFAFGNINGGVSLSLDRPLPVDEIESTFIVLEIEARRERAVSAWTSVVVDIIRADAEPLLFTRSFYQGIYHEATGIVTIEEIALSSGFDEIVTFGLEGEHASLFTLREQATNSQTIDVVQPISSDVLENYTQLLFTITASKPNAIAAQAAISITIERVHQPARHLQFSKDFYRGSIQDNILTMETINLDGYTDGVSYSFTGDNADYFQLMNQAGTFTLELQRALSVEILQAQNLFIFTLEAQIEGTRTHTTIIIEIVKEDDTLPASPRLVFDATYYTGSYSAAAGLTFNTPIVLAEGFDPTVVFALDGEQAQWFGVVQDGSTLTLRVTSAIPAAVLANNHQLVFVVVAERSSVSTRATIVISLTDDNTHDAVLGFDRVTYQGSIQNNVICLDPLRLEGYTQDVTFTLHGELSSYFSLSPQGAGVVQVLLPAAIPDQYLPTNQIIVLEIRASAPQALAAAATIVLEVIVDDEQPPSVPQLVFDATYYTGSYSTAAGLTFDTPIVLVEGHDPTVVFTLDGEQAQWFGVVQDGNTVRLRVTSAIPTAVLANHHQLVFVIVAERPGSVAAQATIVISLVDDLQTDEDVSFNRLVYEGIIRLSEVQHESIIISNFDGDNVQLHGEHSSLFEARLLNGVVTIHAVGSLSFLAGTLVTLELHAGRGRAVLLLNVLEAGAPALPTVTFSSPSYIFNVEIVQTGVIGRVLATADNGEAVAYSLAIENAHLQARVSINNEGEVHLSAPANSGVYTFQVIATTVITRAEGTATIHLTVESVTVCGDDITVPPLIILDRDEEEPHNNLVTLDRSQHEGCRYTLTNRWPLDQNWLYVDDNGLHARSIDREHESIAYMALSQVQVELILHCEGDSAIRAKRSQRLDWLGPYDYGLNQWILTESIPYNARRSRVNLIVNDINDNVPIFVGKESEPIAVGYPIPDIEERILPRSLAELQATDADVGLNAALKYWSSEDVLAVAPTSGFVHVRTGARLLDNQRLTVSATDRNGEGLTGEILLLVKLLDLSNIVVVTVKNAFLDDEKTILSRLSEVIGYEVKALRSVVISDDQNEDSRKKRETSTTGASLMIYMYGLIQREPVSVDRLTTDIYNNAAVINVISTVSLEDHLEPTEIIITKSSIGLLVATIVLGVLLFIIILVIAIWFFLKWRKNKNYNQFTDQNSLASRNSSEDKSAELEVPKTRLNIEELKKSENRLQERLKVPIQDVTIEAVPPRREGPLESIIDLPSPDSSGPIVIQSIDKLKDADESDTDEFGEKPGPRRKSVVTFNENVEKIIHVEDNDDDTETVSSQSSYEVYKL